MNSIKFVLLVCAALVVSVVAQSSTKRPAQPINAWCSKALDGKVEDDPDVAAAVSRARGKYVLLYNALKSIRNKIITLTI